MEGFRLPGSPRLSLSPHVQCWRSMARIVPVGTDGRVVWLASGLRIFQVLPPRRCASGSDWKPGAVLRVSLVECFRTEAAHFSGESCLLEKRTSRQNVEIAPVAHAETGVTGGTTFRVTGRSRLVLDADFHFHSPVPGAGLDDAEARFPEWIMRRPGLVHHDAQHALPPGGSVRADFSADSPRLGDPLLGSLAGFAPAADGDPIHQVAVRVVGGQPVRLHFCD